MHDVMLAHTSEGLVSQPQRQVIYFELRSLKHMLNNPKMSREWISARQHLKKIEHEAYGQRVRDGAASGQTTEALTESTKRRSIEDVYKLPLGRETGRYCNPHSNAKTSTASQLTA